MVKDYEEDLEEIMKKCKPSVLSLSSQQMTLQTQSETIKNYKDEKIKLVEEIENLHQHLDLECEPLNLRKQSIFLYQIEELERKLEFGIWKRQEIVTERLKQIL